MIWNKHKIFYQVWQWRSKHFLAINFRIFLSKYYSNFLRSEFDLETAVPVFPTLIKLLICVGIWYNFKLLWGTTETALRNSRSKRTHIRIFVVAQYYLFSILWIKSYKRNALEKSYITKAASFRLSNDVIIWSEMYERR